jgi:tRNA dimethylallyltransferase
MPALIIIAGPTASGKSSLALQVAKHFSTEILSADSRQFYKKLNIGTAKPSAAELQTVRHHFIDSLDPEETYNVFDYEQDALKVLEKIFSVRDVAVMAGGSGLYIRAICEGIDESPGSNEDIRKDLIKLQQSHGLVALQGLLKQHDPEYYAVVDLKNSRRLIRALEVCIGTGKKYSDMRTARTVKRDFRIIRIGLRPDRKELYGRIDARVDEMIEQGLVEEARSLMGFKHLNSLNTVGYKELFPHFEGRITLEEAIDQIKQNTRNYAKRQMTWFRKDKDIHWFDTTDPQRIIQWLEKEINSPSKPLNE